MPTNWNYRITRECIDKESKTYYYCIREVYYDENWEAHTWSADARLPEAYHSEKDFRKTFEYMAQALERPVLTISGDNIIQNAIERKKIELRKLRKEKRKKYMEKYYKENIKPKRKHLSLNK